MSRVCSMESKATLPVLVRRAGREWQRLIHHPWEGKDSWHVREKSAWFAYLLKEPPESPVLSSDPKKTTTGTLQRQRQHRNSTGLSGPITPQKSPTTAQPETSFCPTNLPRDTSFSNAYLIFDKLITRRTHTQVSNLPIELYSDSTCSTPELSQAPLANFFSRSSTS